MNKVKVLFGGKITLEDKMQPAHKRMLGRIDIENVIHNLILIIFQCIIIFQTCKTLKKNNNQGS